MLKTNTFDTIDQFDMNKFSEQEGRLLAVLLRIEDLRLCLVNCYAPVIRNEIDHLAFLGDIETLLKGIPSQYKLIIGGDFNLVLDCNIDSRGGNPKPHRKCKNKLKKIMAEHNLIDTFRHNSPKDLLFSYSGIYRKGEKIERRLDYFFLTESLNTITKNQKIIPSSHSDHAILQITLDVRPRSSILQSNFTGKCIFHAKFRISLKL